MPRFVVAYLALGLSGCAAGAGAILLDSWACFWLMVGLHTSAAFVMMRGLWRMDRDGRADRREHEAYMRAHEERMAALGRPYR